MKNLTQPQDLRISNERGEVSAQALLVTNNCRLALSASITSGNMEWNFYQCSSAVEAILDEAPLGELQEMLPHLKSSEEVTKLHALIQRAGIKMQIAMLTACL